jgi:mono/diheme cytochrome c family protein
MEEVHPSVVAKTPEATMRTLRLSASIVAAAMIGGPGAGYAQGIEIGKAEYVNSCASCHGVTGKGEGAVAQSLKRAPSDLTKLSESNLGVFPFSHVYDVIDGRFEVATHGKREMPVWGFVYQPAWNSTQSLALPYGTTNAMGESIVRGRILALIDYIFSLQAK